MKKILNSTITTNILLIIIIILLINITNFLANIDENSSSTNSNLFSITWKVNDIQSDVSKLKDTSSNIESNTWWIKNK